MWHKAEWIGHPMRLELTHVGLLVSLANRYTTGEEKKVCKWRLHLMKFFLNVFLCCWILGMKDNSDKFLLNLDILR